MAHGKFKILFSKPSVFKDSHTCYLGMGGDADTVIGASVCLDSECMRLITGAYLQKKADIINRNTMKDIIMVRPPRWNPFSKSTELLHIIHYFVLIGKLGSLLHR